MLTAFYESRKNHRVRMQFSGKANRINIDYGV